MSEEVSLTSYGPEKSIGGNCLELRVGKKNILLDCGCNYFPFADLPIPPWKLPAEFLSKFGFFPSFQGKEDKNVELLLLSHAHIDHYGSIPYLLSLYKLKSFWCGDFANKKVIRSTFGFFRKKREVRKKFVNLIRPNTEAIMSGSFIRDVKIIPLEVKHSTLDCYGFTISTPNMNLLYTGDFENPNLNVWEPRNGELIYKSRTPIKFKIDVLITEGTLLGQSSKGVDETEVKKLLEKTINITKGPVAILVSRSNLKRIRTILETVTPLRRVYISERFKKSIPIERLTEGIPKNHLEKVTVCKKGIKITDIVDAPPFSNSAILLNMAEVFSQWHLSLLTRREKLWAQPSTYILCIDITYQIYRNKIVEILVDFLRKNGINIVEAHARGHIDTLKLIDFITELNPKYIIPIHSQYPDFLKKYFPSKTIIPKQGESIELNI